MSMVKILFFIIISFPTICFAAKLDDVYVQAGGKMIGFSDTVREAKGSIASTGKPSKYLINLNGRKAVVDFSSNKSISAEMSVFYPDHIVIQISFLNVKPNTLAFIDSSPISTIDKHGNSITPKFPISESGEHKIELRVLRKVVDSAPLLNIPISATVECSGKEKMKCKVTNM